jgi:hypothetical protein
MWVDLALFGDVKEDDLVARASLQLSMVKQLFPYYAFVVTEGDDKKLSLVPTVPVDERDAVKGLTVAIASVIEGPGFLFSLANVHFCMVMTHDVDCPCPCPPIL